MITIKLKESNSSIKSKIAENISLVVNRVIRRKRGAIVRDIRAAIPKWIESQPEIKSLRSSDPNSLAYHFGIPPSEVEDKIEAIVKATVNSLSIEVKELRKRDLNGGIKLNFMPATFADLLNLPEGHTIDENNDLHWLNWLLTEGFKVIVVGYHFTFERGKGRSKGGYMSNAGIWRVPPQFAGTVEDNFITRALNNPSNEQEIQRILQRHLK